VPAAEAGPVTPAEADRLFCLFAGHPHVALAVSGGADSTALLFLAQRWRQAQSGATKLSVLTVDHGLRAQARVEAEAVVRLAGRFGLFARLLTWQGVKPASGIQDAAREARRELLLGAARELGATAIALAHTADDQAETLVMRLARGSGLDGLAAMAPALAYKKIMLLRPLLGVSHARLVATLNAEGLCWSDDPANVNPDFERVRVRRLLAVLAGSGIGTAALAHSAERLGRARAALQDITEAAWVRLMMIRPEGFIEVDRAAFAAEPAEIRVRLMERGVRIAGGAVSDSARLSAVEAVAAWLETGHGRARTLAGARIVRRRDTILIGREPGRLGTEPVQLVREGLLWDGRFIIRPGGDTYRSLEGLAIVPGKALGDGVLKLGGKETALPRFVTDTRPVVVTGDRPLGFAGVAATGLEAHFAAAARDEGEKCG